MSSLLEAQADRAKEADWPNDLLCDPSVTPTGSLGDRTSRTGGADAFLLTHWLVPGRTRRDHSYESLDQIGWICLGMDWSRRPTCNFKSSRSWTSAVR